MKVSKRFTTKHRIVKAYNRSHCFKPMNGSRILGDTTYNSLLVAGVTNSCTTTLGLAVLINYIRHNPRLTLGVPNLVYICKDYEPSILVLWELINHRAIDDMKINEAIAEKRQLMFGDFEIDASNVDASVRVKSRQISEASFRLEKERQEDVVKWFSERGYRLKVSDHWEDVFCEIIRNLAKGYNVIYFKDNVHRKLYRHRLLSSLNCMSIDITRVHTAALHENAQITINRIGSLYQTLMADRVVFCSNKKCLEESGQVKRVVSLVKNRRGFGNIDGVNVSTIDLIKTLVK